MQLSGQPPPTRQHCPEGGELDQSLPKAPTPVPRLPWAFPPPGKLWLMGAQLKESELINRKGGDELMIADK